MAVMRNNKKILIGQFIKTYKEMGMMRNQSRGMMKIKKILKMSIKFIVFRT